MEMSKEYLARNARTEPIDELASAAAGAIGDAAGLQMERDISSGEEKVFQLDENANATFLDNKAVGEEKSTRDKIPLLENNEVEIWNGVNKREDEPSSSSGKENESGLKGEKRASQGSASPKGNVVEDNSGKKCILM